MARWMSRPPMFRASTAFAVKISPGFFDNPKHRPSGTTSGLMVLFSSRTGMLEAVLLDNGYLTDIRTAAAGAVAAKSPLQGRMPPPPAYVGAGAQARLQLEALALVRPIQSATIWARDAGKASAAADDNEAGSYGNTGACHPASDLAERGFCSGYHSHRHRSPTAPVLMADWLRDPVST